MVARFCDLLTGEERQEMHALLAEYSRKVERFALLSARGQEYELALRLSRNSLQDSLRRAAHRQARALLLGGALGACAALIVFLR